MLRRSLSGLIGSMLVAASVQAGAAELSFAIGHPPQSYLVEGGRAFAASLSQETGGETTARIYPMSLLSLAETSPGLRDGLADIGTVLSTYHAGEYPATNLIHDASMILDRFADLPRGLQGAAYAPAMAEFILTRCPECVAEFSRQNQVYTGAAATTPYALGCIRPVRTPQEFRGARLRVGGANWARWAEAMQGAAVTMAGNEMLEALTQGIIDCVVLSLPDIRNFGLTGSIRHVTADVPGGVYVVAFANINRDVWLKLTAAQRTAVMKAAAQGTAVSNFAYRQGEAQVLAQIRANGGRVYDADLEVRAATSRFAQRDLDDLARIYAARGVARGAKMIEEFLPLLDKWVARTRSVSSADELAEIYWSELYSKIDVAAYGR